MENRTIGFENYCETFLELFSERFDDVGEEREKIN